MNSFYRVSRPKLGASWIKSLCLGKGRGAQLLRVCLIMSILIKPLLLASVSDTGAPHVPPREMVTTLLLIYMCGEVYHKYSLAFLNPRPEVNSQTPFTTRASSSLFGMKMAH